MLYYTTVGFKRHQGHRRTRGGIRRDTKRTGGHRNTTRTGGHSGGSGETPDAKRTGGNKRGDRSGPQGHRDPTDGQEGKMCCGEEGSERTPSSYLTILHVQSGQLCVCAVGDGWMANRRLHSKRKKRKALATHHLFFYQSNNLQKEGSPHFWQVTYVT